ncbi:hypothetical protein JW890_02080 [candidate division WOR-3 bacterium]|nr:hypothetical protein [candidate division WOR-3 bacterium]
MKGSAIRAIKVTKKIIKSEITNDSQRAFSGLTYFFKKVWRELVSFSLKVFFDTIDKKFRVLANVRKRHTVYI